jgi:two-component system, OmpR family, response regulator
VKRATRKIELAAREFALIEQFVRSPGRVFTRAQICEEVWGYHFDPGSNLVDVYVQRLRTKIHGDASVKLTSQRHEKGLAKNGA